MRWARAFFIMALAAALFFMDKADLFDFSVGAINRFLMGPMVRTTFRLGEQGGFLFKNLFGVRGLIKENLFLKSERDFFRAEYFKLLALREENEFLRQAAAVSKRDGQKIIVANILSFDPFEAQDSLVLDKGERDGVVEGNAVVLAGNILVGRVSEIGSKDSRVRLINSTQSRVTAITEEGGATGVVTGSVSGALTFDLVLKEARLARGQILLSSGLDGLFKRGWLVGEVIEISNPDSAPFQKALVRPLFSPRDLKQVFIAVD